MSLPIAVAKAFEYHDNIWEKESFRVKNLSIRITRNCCNNCTFCIDNKNKRIDKLDLNIAFDKLENSNNIETCTLVDSIATFYKEHFIEFAKKFNMLYPNIILQFNLEANYFDDDIARACSTGKYIVRFGFESASRELRESLNKYFKNERASRIAELCDKYNIICFFNLLLGIPNETRDDLESSLQFILKYDNIIPQPLILQPLYGTELYQDCVRNNTLNLDGTIKNLDYNLVNEYYNKFLFIEFDKIAKSRTLSQNAFYIGI